MNNIIDLLKQNKSLSTYAIFREIKKSSHSIRNALHYLLVLKVVNVEQHYYTRIWRLTKDWNVCLNKAIIEYNSKNIIYSSNHIDTNHIDTNQKE